MALTKISGSVIKDSVSLSGNVSVGGTLTYQDVTNVDALGIGTFRTGINVSGGQLVVGNNIKLGNAGVVTATELDISGDIDVDGHTELDNVSISGVATVTGTLGSGDITITSHQPKLSLTDISNNPDWSVKNANGNFAINDETASATRFSINSSNGVEFHMHAVPSADSTYDLGLTGTRWRNVYADTLYGDGSNLTGITGTTINNNADNRVITGSGTANTLEGEANLTFETATTGGTLTVAGTSEYQLRLKDSDSSGNGAETALAFTDSGNTIQGFVGYNYWGDGNLDIQNNNSGGKVCINTGGGNERLVVTSDGDIYGPSGGRKNWFDNGSFDCIGGRRANTSMDYGNHHAYGWVTDRFQSRNSVQWTRSSNVPAGKGFSYSTQTNGAGGRLVQAVELPDYGDMGVFVPNSYWCVSVWSTAAVNQSGQAFSYDLGSTKTDIPIVTPSSGGVYLSSGETASGTSTGTFTRYYAVFQMPSSIISTATSAYFTWAFQAAGYATGFQLERVPTSTSKPTPYEHVHPAVTTARCRRYCYQNVNSRLINGYKRHDSNIHWAVQHPVPPTHMPSGSNQSADPYGITMHDGGMLTNFQSILQNPGVNSLARSEFDYRSGRFLIVGSTSWSSTHTTAPAWESQEYEISHGHF
tara:strand:+ start:7 stop:1938 length:1932 start_codon:yes stop_codon:yes gene_type:complete